MAIKALIVGVHGWYQALKQYIDEQVNEGNLEIVGYAVLENGGYKIYNSSRMGGVN